MLRLQRCYNIIQRNLSSRIHLEAFHQSNFINNEFVKSYSGESFTTKSPFDGSKIGTFWNSSERDVNAAIDNANKQFQQYKRFSNDERSNLLYSLSEKLNENKSQLAECISLEMGKPVTESINEVDSSIAILKWYAQETKRIHGELYDPGNSKKLFVLHKPHGVVGLITPWNFPLNMIIRSFGGAVGAGCTVVNKPAPETPLTALFLAELIRLAGFPGGVFNVITADSINSRRIGQFICADDRIRHISFTGSTDVGKILMSLSGKFIKRCSLELGGNAPFIVYQSADLELAVKCLMYAKFRNNGQTCISANRIFLHYLIYDEFLEKLAITMEQLKFGNPKEISTELTCLYSEKGRKKVEDLVESAIKSGAKCYYQRKTVSGAGPAYYPPTILTECTPTMKLARQEIFGPVCAIYSFNDQSAMLEEASCAKVGLAAYIYSNDLNQVFETIQNLEVGLVAVNSSSPSTYLLPFGGHKESGLGSEMGMKGIYHYLDTQSVVINH